MRSGITTSEALVDKGPENLAFNPELPFRLSLSTTHPALDDFPVSVGTVRHLDGGVATQGIMTGRIAFPIHDPSGVLVAYAGVVPNNPSDWLFPKAFRLELELFNVHRVLDGVREDHGAGLIVVSGIMETLSVIEAGFEGVMGLLSPPSSRQIELIELAAVSFESRISLVLPEGEGRARIRDALVPHHFLRIRYTKEASLLELSVPERARLLV